jgi:mannose-6-phosphate isomerase
MTIEHACTRIVHKPWGSTDLRPWSAIDHDADAIGELWFQRADATAPDSALLFKLLFTRQPLSIQVHPDDEFARSIGLAHGKDEAWYILSAAPNAKIAIGLKRRLTAPQLRAAIADGSISDLVRWRRALKDDVIFVPAGTIHAIGAGLVLAEIQQRSDATFRLFDHGRQRALHVDDGVAAAHAGPAEPQAALRRLTDARTLLVASPHFVLERVDLAAGSTWVLQAEPETWLLVVAGHARVGQTDAVVGEAIFLEADCASIEVGSDGLKGLLAYAAAEPNPSLLRDLGSRRAEIPNRGLPLPSPHHRAATWSRTISMEVRP